MAPRPSDRRIAPAVGFASPEGGSFFAQLEDLSGCLAADTRGATPDELAWQPRPGTNTIGMLLAHVAIVEVAWLGRAAGRPVTDFPAVLGIGIDDDGIPIAAEGAPPAALAGKDLAWYDALLARARAFTRATLAPMTPADFDRVESRERDGVRQTFNVRWIVYHVLEHQAGHYGQINLLRHLHRAERGAAVAS